MRTTIWIRLVSPGVMLSLLTAILSADPAVAADLKVMKMGLGTGTVMGTGINCGGDCNETFMAPDIVTLTATADPGSRFAGWDEDPDKDMDTTADCTGNGACSVTMNADHYLRPVFDLDPAIATLGGVPTPTAIQMYLDDHLDVDTPAKFLKALPENYKWNWILMTRSESLQTGTAEFPRILLPSPDGQYVFSYGLAQHSAYPGAHPNAIEYMQWDPGQKNFRFHEIVLGPIGAMGTFPARVRRVYADDARCTKCHSTQNIPNTSPFIGTTGIPPVRVLAKNKPNWDTYDSWGGMLAFNRDRIYQGSVEAAAFRKLLNPWTWRGDPATRAIMEQLRLQPPVPGIATAHEIKRSRSGNNDGHVNFKFDGTPPPPVTTEPRPMGTPPAITPNYEFNRVAGAGPGTSVERQGTYVTLHHSNIPGSDEGRAVRFFDNLGGGAAGNFNQQRIGDELAKHRYATGSVRMDVRPIALAITNGCVAISGGTVTSTAATALAVDLTFFTDRNGGMTIANVRTDTDDRKKNLTRRKADIQKLNLHRDGDSYTLLPPAPVTNGLLAQYGAALTPLADPSLMARLRQEVFRRSIDIPMTEDRTVMGGIYIDREFYADDLNKVALYRYFLEPLGVSVDKWSMGVRGRSRTYTFADVFGTYLDDLSGALQADLTREPVVGLVPPLPPLPAMPGCDDLIRATNHTLRSLPDRNQVPTYTDVQRIFNKACIECHGGLEYPPYLNRLGDLDLSENETPPPLPAQDRLLRSWQKASVRAGSLMGPIYRFITRPDEDCLPGIDDMMPCGGPPLSKVDIETIKRWINGGAPYTLGDPHIRTIGGVDYDFQGAGEYVLLRGVGMEVQARHTAVETEGPLGPNGHTGLTSCVSLNTAAAVKVGSHRITYQPNLSGKPDPEGLQLHIDGKLTAMSGPEILLPSGGRIVRTAAPGGIQIEGPDGAVVVITPGWWDHYQLWYLNIDGRQVKATEGLMGNIAPRNWLPALPDGKFMGPRPADLQERYQDLYGKFGNAWRVTDRTSLFDYAPGTSTRTFTISSWPLGESPQACRIPKELVTRAPQPPLKTLALEVAEKHCGGVVADNLKALCVQDVRVTGEPGFAKTYLLTEQIKRNRIPASPVLVSPEDRKEDLNKPVTFTWNGTSDSDGDPVTYRYCVWSVNKGFTLNDCEVISDPTTSQTTTSRTGGFFCALLVLLFGCLLFAVLLYMGMKKKPVLLVLVAIATLIAVILALYFCGTKTFSKTVSGLESGKAYFWKVIAEDGKGGSTESETRRFTVK